VASVTGNATYTAAYDSSVNEYTVTFVNEDGTELQSGKVAYGETPKYAGETPAKASTAQYSYSFTGWTPEVAAVTGNTTYTATFGTVTAGPFSISGGTPGEDYSYEVSENDTGGTSGEASIGCLTVLTDTALTIANADQDTVANAQIVVSSGIDANITLDGVNISAATEEQILPAICFEEGSEDITAVIQVADDSVNTLSGGLISYSPGTLELNGNGALSLTGSEEDSAIVSVSGGLTVSGGIELSVTGGSVGIEAETFTLEDGSLTVQSDYGISAGTVSVQGGSLSLENTGEDISCTSFEIADGSVALQGRGIDIQQGSFSMSGGEISGTSEFAQYAIRLDGSEFTITGGSISAVPGKEGSPMWAVYAEGMDSALRLHGGTITGDSTASSVFWYVPQADLSDVTPIDSDVTTLIKTKFREAAIQILWSAATAPENYGSLDYDEETGYYVFTEPNPDGGNNP